MDRTLAYSQEQVRVFDFLNLAKDALKAVASGGANYFPGNVAGTTATGGQYA